MPLDASSQYSERKLYKNKHINKPNGSTKAKYALDFMLFYFHDSHFVRLHLELASIFTSLHLLMTSNHIISNS